MIDEDGGMLGCGLERRANVSSQDVQSGGCRLIMTWDTAHYFGSDCDA